jgi:putative glutamine amidotransferase
MRPLIAVIGRRATKPAPRRYSGTIAAEAVCDALVAAGGEPVILHGGGPGDLAAMPKRLGAFAGVCLPGGGDLNPAAYGQERTELSAPPDDRQDDFDLAVIRPVLAQAVPALAICRGLQVLNVACGGTLHQHVPPGPVIHKDAPHEVTLAAGSRLRELAGADVITVSSRHHQSIDRVGRGLRVVACAPDGCIEAVEHVSAGVLAVQWHPEDLAASHPHEQALFTDLVDRARAGEAVRAA